MLNHTRPAVLAAALLMTCAFGGGVAGAATSPASARTGTGAASSSSPGVAVAAPMKRTVDVRLTEYAIEMPLRLSAGPTVFKVTNDGGMYHRFEIEGKGIEKELESGVDAGETKMLELNLEPGSYEVYCPVRGHKKAGMFLRVQVT